MKARAALLSMLLVVSLVGAAAAPAAAQDASGEAYSGAHVQFDAGSSSVANYAVNGDVLVENVTIQSSSKARSQTGVNIDADLETATNFRGSGLQVASKTSVSATIAVESGAEMQTHDNSRGVFQVRAQESDQMVRANISERAQAESKGDKRVVVTKEDGSEGSFIVIGDGEVVVNEQGNVTAEVKEGSQLVYRQYDTGRDDGDEKRERMIQNGTATAEVYIQQAQQSGEDSSDESQEAAASVVEYGQDTSVEVTSQSKNNVEMAVDRSQSQGKVVLTTVSESAFDSAENIQVLVDGEAAAQADSYSAVEQSAMQGDQPRYYVSQSSSANAAANVAIGIDHFSTRNVQMTSGDGEGDTSNGSGAGFGALVALAALGAALVGTRRRQ
ncbi:MAG: PGF-CTERM protein [Natronomonas sp.]|jgi:PGF-CTERM protein|uniref:PGF-CTERM sorting domain-containing protein n=1 Tax=Natronomonas sp. TaxID=2184060 RepID=UPI003988E9DC